VRVHYSLAHSRGGFETLKGCRQQPRCCCAGRALRYYYYDDGGGGVGELMCREVCLCKSVCTNSCLNSASSQMRAPNGMQMAAMADAAGVETLLWPGGKVANHTSLFLCGRARSDAKEQPKQK